MSRSASTDSGGSVAADTDRRVPCRIPGSPLPPSTTSPRSTNWRTACAATASAARSPARWPPAHDQLVVNDQSDPGLQPVAARTASRGPTPASTWSSRPPAGSAPVTSPGGTSPTAAPARWSSARRPTTRTRSSSTAPTTRATTRPRHDVVSPASCGVNALTIMAKVLLDRFGLRSVNTSVMLATQGWQKAQDTADRRLAGRSAAGPGHRREHHPAQLRGR